MPAAAPLPSQQHMQEICDDALARSHGIRIPFTSKHYGSYAEAKSKVRAFQTHFSSFRARARRLKQRAMGNEFERDTYVQGPYDALSCVKTELPNGAGFEIWLCKGIGMDFLDHILDGETGEPIAKFNNDERQWERLSLHFIALVGELNAACRANPQVKRINPLSKTDTQWMMDYDADATRRIFASADLPAPDASKESINSEYDPANVAVDDMFKE